MQEEGSRQAQLQLQERLEQAEAEAADAAQQLRFQVQATESLQGSLDTLAAERDALREAQTAAGVASQERLQAAQRQVERLLAETARLSAQCQALEDRQAAAATEHLTTVDRLVRMMPCLTAPQPPTLG